MVPIGGVPISRLPTVCDKDDHEYAGARQLTRSYYDIQGRPNADSWYAACHQELIKLFDMETFDIVDSSTITKGTKVMDTCFSFKRKEDSNGKPRSSDVASTPAAVGKTRVVAETHLLSDFLSASRGPFRVRFQRRSPGNTTLSELRQTKVLFKVGTLSYNWSTIGPRASSAVLDKSVL